MRESVVEIPRSARPTAERFRAEHARGRVPVVLRGFVDDWPARHWELASIVEHWPKRSVRGHGPSGDGVSVREVHLTSDDLVRCFMAPGGESADAHADWLVDLRESGLGVVRSLMRLF